MRANKDRWVRAATRIRPALVGAALILPLLGGLAYGFWSGPSWHSGPISADLEADLSPHHFAAAAAPVEVALEAEARPATVSRTLRVARGDTLMGLLTEAGIDRREAYEAITALREVFRPRDLMPGQEIRVNLAAPMEPEGAERLLSLRLQPNVERDVRVWRSPEAAGFVTEALDRPLERGAVGAAGAIESNLSLAAREAGLPVPVLTDLIRIFSFDVDFQRELRAGDEFEVLYGALFEEDGTLAKTEEILFAALTLSDQRLELFRFTPSSGRPDYFDPKGQSVRKTLMRTPIDGARLSSGYGMRRHPILGYSRMHRGIDFAAPTGTPIYAAGDGVVEAAGWNGGYGRYLRVRHNSTYKTAYAHLSRIAKGVRRGQRVTQGQVIGYVGTSGRSTGPHLHYEVMVAGRQVNPLKVKLPSGEKLKGRDLEAFAARRAEIEALHLAALEGEVRLARAGCPARPAEDGGLQPAACPAPKAE